MSSIYTASHAAQLDAADPLAHFRQQFYFPTLHGRTATYFTGNSLGLQPKTTQDHVLTELEDWASYGVEGHLHARHPWLHYHEQFAQPLARITGALPHEVVAMNQLTVNLHLLLISFYRPSGTRTKIMCEAKAFPSDIYALQSQVAFHGLNPDTEIIYLTTGNDDEPLTTEYIVSQINTHAQSLALVMLGGVNYYTGQVFDMATITDAAHAVGALAGFDLAHAVGNVSLQLHQWQVDFACWCSYKYLNSGPGGVAGAFIHERHHTATLPRLHGWWGTSKQHRFQMLPTFDPIPTAEAWQLSNAPVLSMAAHKASLQIFDQATMPALLHKSALLTSYLHSCITQANTHLAAQQVQLTIITPSGTQRGCQLSIIAQGQGKALHQYLLQHSIITDWREPNVIRLAPVPLYNSFTDIHYLYHTLLHYRASSM